MGDLLCKAMGMADIIAGGLIMYFFNLNVFGIIFGIAMIIKGIVSLVG